MPPQDHNAKTIATQMPAAKEVLRGGLKVCRPHSIRGSEDLRLPNRDALRFDLAGQILTGSTQNIQAGLAGKASDLVASIFTCQARRIA